MDMDIRALKPGTVIHNRYMIQKVLGTGGFGVTYKVLDQREKKIAAMKEYMPLDAAYRPLGGKTIQPTSEGMRRQFEKFRLEFQKEAQTIYSFRGHPNIVEVYHLFLENNTCYYVMEYVEGMDLRQFLDKQPGKRMSWDMLRPIVAQVVAGLRQIHGVNMIHCDISPDNIFLMNSGAVKLLDFGAAKDTFRGELETSVIVAKPGFSPYEQMRGKGMGPWTDVYALAVTIYRCITGKNIQDATERINADKTIWPSQMGLAIPSQTWEAALKKGMAVRKEERYQNVLDFWNALNGSAVQTIPVQPENPKFDQVGATVRNSTPIQPGGFANTLECVQGVFAGKRIPILQEYYLGVDTSRCHIVFPLGTPGISRVHLRVWSANGRIMVMDMNSTYGSWIDGKKLTPGLVYTMNAGSTLFLGGGQVFRGVS